MLQGADNLRDNDCSRSLDHFCGEQNGAETKEVVSANVKSSMFVNIQSKSGYMSKSFDDAVCPHKEPVSCITSSASPLCSSSVVPPILVENDRREGNFIPVQMKKQHRVSLHTGHHTGSCP